MSAESPRKSNRQGGYVVAPQPVTDRSIIESVAGFINEVVPQGYSAPGGDCKETVITWARFEQADINDPGLYPDSVDEPIRAPPLLLILGYANGVQVWAVPASGEASEVLSWRQGIVRTLRILPTPATGDSFAHKRPLVALCDTASPGPQFCSLSFISLRAGDQVKSIKFKNPVTNVLANVRCIVVTFLERIAVFDACTLEDRMTVTTCYPSPGVNVNPVALGSRWLAYADRRLSPAKRCSGGTEGEGIQSYTATVLHAAKSLSKGLRELGETVASSLTGGATPPGIRVPGATPDTDFLNPGIVTILEVRGTPKENSRSEESVVAHFSAHGDAIVAMQFDPSGMLLATADKRGHDFHVFRIQPHPGGSSLAAVHHLYVLHRGDTTAKVQDMVFAWDSRWLAVSTLRGTTHVFPVTPYGGAVGLRTHSTPHVVNRLSRFHRSAGLTADGRNSPQPCDSGGCGLHHPAMAHANPRLPPYPHPTVVTPLAQIRQSQPAPVPAPGRSPSTRRSNAPDETGTVPLRVSACFGAPRAWLVGSPTAPRDSSTRARRRAVDSLFVMACHGNLIQYDLETKHASGTPREKVCDDTPIELDVQAKAQWTLGGLLRTGGEIQPPLPATSLLIAPPSLAPPLTIDQSDERWLSQVEIVTHAGPHRRLWMGPQFTFKTTEPEGPGSRLVRSNPVNMPVPPVVPVLIESGSGSSYEQSPRLLEAYGHSTDGSDGSGGPGDIRLREDLADAMLESPGVANRHTGRRVIVEICSGKRSQAIPIEKIVNPVGSVLTVLTDEGSCDGAVGDPEAEEATVRWPTDVIRMPPEEDILPKCEAKSEISKQNSRKGRSNARDMGYETACLVNDVEPSSIKTRNQQSLSSRKETEKPGESLPEKVEKNRSKKKTAAKDREESYVDVHDNFKSSAIASTKEADSSLISKTVDMKGISKAPSERIASLSLATASMDVNETKNFVQSAATRNTIDQLQPTPKVSKKQLNTSKAKKVVNVKSDPEPLVSCQQPEELKDISFEVELPSATELLAAALIDCGDNNYEHVSTDMCTKTVPLNGQCEKKKEEFPELKCETKGKGNPKDKSNKDKKSRSPLKSKFSVESKGDSDLFMSSIKDDIKEFEIIDTVIETSQGTHNSRLEMQEKPDSKVVSRSRKYQGLDLVDVDHSVQENVSKGGSKKKLKMFEMSEAFLMETGEPLDSFTQPDEIGSVESVDPLVPNVDTSLLESTLDMLVTATDMSPNCSLDVSEHDPTWCSVDTSIPNAEEFAELSTIDSSVANGNLSEMDETSVPDIDASPIRSGLDMTRSTTEWAVDGDATHQDQETWNDSPSTTWSNIASGKKREESIPKEEALPVKSWSTVVKTFSADSSVACPVEIKPVETRPEAGLPMDEEETPTSAQANKKTRKVKKKRR